MSSNRSGNDRKKKLYFDKIDDIGNSKNNSYKRRRSAGSNYNINKNNKRENVNKYSRNKGINSNSSRSYYKNNPKKTRRNATNSRNIEKKDSININSYRRRIRPLIRGERYYDYTLLLYVVLVSAFGLVIRFSISTDDNIIKQCAIVIIGIFIMIFASFCPIDVYRRFSYIILALSIVMMAMVRYTDLGVSSHESKRWLSLGFITIQPSEIAKLAIILVIPNIIMKARDIYLHKKDFSMLQKYYGIAIFIGGLTSYFVYEWTDNLSTAVIVFMITIMQIVIVFKHFIKWNIGLGLLAGLFIIYKRIKYTKMMFSINNIMDVNFRDRRYITWLDPYKYLQTTGWQVVQGLYAVGSGGLLGKGLGNSTQKLKNIPEAQNDFIFAVVCEELGLFGAIAVIGLFIGILSRLIFICINCKDLYARLVAYGIFAHIFLQVFLNISVVLNLIPTTGISLPLISQGGTAIFILMVELGIALSISREIYI